MTNIYILCGTRQEFEDFIRLNRNPTARYIHINCIDKLIGIIDPIVFRIGTFWKMEELLAIEEYIKTRQITK